MYIHTHFKLQTIEKLIYYIRFCVRYLHLVNLIDSPHIRPSVNDRCPGFFFGFRRKLACTKPQQSTDKASEHNGRTVFTRVSSGGVNFVFYPLSSLHFTSSIFVPTLLFASAYATSRVCLLPGLYRNNK